MAERFGELTVIGDRYRGVHGRFHVVCRCDCGKEVPVREDCLKSGNTRSCGCLQLRVVKAAAKHGMHQTRTYRIWAGMRQRCTNPNAQKAHLYCGAGITVDERWNDFSSFIEDMGEAPAGMSIDRIDGTRGYSKANCRWATPVQQANNMRTNKVIEFNGQRKTLAEWARSLGIKANTLNCRLRRGWPIERALA